MINSALRPIVLAAFFLTAPIRPAEAAPSPDVRAVGEAGSNVFFSPFSVSQALILTMSGAGGQTRTEMAKTLGLTALAPA